MSTVLPVFTAMKNDQDTLRIRLTRGGALRLELQEALPPSRTWEALQRSFEADWRSGLFLLAAEKISCDGWPTLRFWQDWAARYLTALCHVPAEMASFAVDPPADEACEAQVLAAPPMRGGEYLTADVLRGVWFELDGWVRSEIEGGQGLEAFLTTRAPQWRQVGRVCFHLAENRQDERRPFAFMASFSTGFGAAGQLKYLALGKALEQYAGAGNRPALIKLLAPVHRAAEICAWVQELTASRRIYQPMAWSAEQAYTMLRSVPLLEEAGLSVRLPNWWKKRARPRVSVKIGETRTTLGTRALLDFDLQVALGDRTLSSEEMQAILDGADGLVFIKGQWVEVDRTRLREAMAHWEKVRRSAGEDGISFIEGMRLLAGASADLKHEEEAERHRPWSEVAAGDALRDILAGLRDPGRLAPVDTGGALKAELRPYQREGLSWLRFLSGLGLGACLADDMGLGKTIQVLALLICAAQEPAGAQRHPALLVVPSSLLGNWRQEAARFTPDLRLVFVHPAETDRRTLDRIIREPARLAEADLVVTTYAMVHRQPWLADRHWRLVILDEAQMVKNPATLQSRAVRRLSADARIALTGTPIENRLADLWSLLDFLNPGLLGSAGVFRSFVKGLEARPENPFEPLRRLVGPYILRRLKTDRRVIADLPEKTEMPCYCTLTRQQVALYEKTVQDLRGALSLVEGIARRGLVLQTLLRLKQICNHPSQVTADGDYRAERSGKFVRLSEIAGEIAERQEKALIFTQFREIIPALADVLAAVFGRPGLVLHGGTPVKHRKGLVAQFQDEDGPPFFILSLKAGGTGLNLTAASHVVHFDRWWNPAVENQATDRAFRIGQSCNVLVHKFITRGTVEERIDALIAEKRQLAEEVLSSEGEVNLTELSDDALIELVRLDISRAAA